MSGYPGSILLPVSLSSIVGENHFSPRICPSRTRQLEKVRPEVEPPRFCDVPSRRLEWRAQTRSSIFDESFYAVAGLDIALESRYNESSARESVKAGWKRDRCDLNPFGVKGRGISMCDTS